MYPEFVAVANSVGDKMALMSLNYAYKTEQKHKVFYEQALAALQGTPSRSCPQCTSCAPPAVTRTTLMHPSVAASP
ncbi:MAG: hypothetical protein IPO17_01050 [Flavobacteriales bacterium]|nr:hypothetical protein [Flavobacteriales bacterium]